MQQVYVELQASQVSTFSVDVPSGADTTSGYYITYQVTPEGGFTGISWYFGVYGNPLEAAGLDTYEKIEERYKSNENNLNDVFDQWLSSVGAEGVHSFCNYLWDNARNCITMV